MNGTMNLSLTDELKLFIPQNSGDGTLYSTKHTEMISMRVTLVFIDPYSYYPRSTFTGRLRSATFFKASKAV
jgi:hypothetical protein